MTQVRFCSPDWIDLLDTVVHVLVDVELVDDGVELEHHVEVVTPASHATQDRQLIGATLQTFYNGEPSPSGGDTGPG